MPAGGACPAPTGEGTFSAIAEPGWWGNASGASGTTAPIDQGSSSAGAGQRLGAGGHLRGEKGGVSSAGPARKGGAGGAKTAAKGKAGADFGKKVKKISNFIQIREENGCKYGRGGV